MPSIEVLLSTTVAIRPPMPSIEVLSTTVATRPPHAIY
jgi:hypothetical protein